MKEEEDEASTLILKGIALIIINAFPFHPSSCPGLLSYHIAAAAVSKLLARSLEEYEVPPEEEDASEVDREASTDRPQAKRSTEIENLCPPTSGVSLSST